MFMFDVESKIDNLSLAKVYADFITEFDKLRSFRTES